MLLPKRVPSRITHVTPAQRCGCERRLPEASKEGKCRASQQPRQGLLGRSASCQRIDTESRHRSGNDAKHLVETACLCGYVNLTRGFAGLVEILLDFARRRFQQFSGLLEKGCRYGEMDVAEEEHRFCQSVSE